MTVTQAPATYNFSGNLPDLIVSTTDPLDFTLSQAGKTIVSENYHPSSDGRVVINLRNILERLVESPGIDQPSFAIPYYTYTVGELSGSFYCVRGGHGAAVSAEAFLKGNFLTWQPQTRRTLYHTPHRLRYAALNVCECKVKGYFADGTSETATLFLGTTADTIYTFDVSFGTVRGKFDAQPTYYDIWMEDASGKALTWTQRYMLVDYLPGTNDYFTFENSLGGFDTIRFSGDRKEINKLESVNAEFNEETIEYDIDRTRSWKKYTGYITDEQTRMWVLDFFNSNNRYHLCDGVFRRIYVSEPKVEDVAGEAAGYEFTYAYSRQSKYINIPRVETPELLEITDPSAEVFFLAPRLNQFQAADPDASEILIPVQTPASGKWLALALSTLIGKVGGGSGPTDEYLLKKVWNEAFSLETAEGERILKALLPVVARLMYVENLIAERADVTDLTASDVDAGSVRADSGDIASLTSENIETAILKVLDKIIAKDQTLSGKISSADFLSGLLGYGWLIDSAGRAEMRSLTLREWLDVPKLRYNRVQVIGSEMWVTEGGAISDVQSSGSQCVVTLKLEEGDPNPFRPADILKGIYHTGTGFQTVMLRVDAVSDDGAMTVTPRYPQLLPQKFMDVARIGNFTDKERQRSILISSKDGRILILGDVDGWDVQPRMVKMIFGDTSGFIHPEFGDMSGYNAFLENILMTGRIYQKSADGQTVKPVPVNKGAWEPGSYYYYDEVTRNGCLWLCTADSTTAEPAEGSPDWIKRVDKGADGAKGDKGDKGDQGLRGLQGEKGDRGIQGEKGADGLTSYFHIKYSPVENPTAAQMTEEPDVYIGTYVDYTPADSDDPSKYAWMRFQGLQGDAGEKGIPGVNGADGKTSFLHIKYSDDGQTFTANNGETPGAWIGQYTDFTEADSSVFSRYAWTKIKGDKGDKGDPGKDGIQGTPGAILRSRGVWKPSEVYIRSAEFIDWVVYGPQKYRYVVKSGVATVPAGILPTNTAYWTAFNEMEPVAAPMFLGETASFDVVGSQAIRVLEEDSSEYGWMLTGGKILHTRTGLALSASGKIEAPDGLAIEMSGKSLEEWTQQKADAAKQAAIDAAAADAADKVDAVQIGSVNLIDGSEEITITAHSSQTHTYKAFPLHIRPGDEFALSVESIEILAGAPEGFTVNIVDSTYNKSLALGELTLDKRTAVYKIPENVIEQDGWFLMYAGKSGKTNGVSVTYREAMLVKGNRPALTWSPSLNDQKEYSDKALDALADIASDDKLTPNEKQDAKREWEIIQGEKPILTAQADTIQLSTADYLNVYNALSAYITPLLADMTTTSTITGSVFNARFKTYYDAKTTLLKNIQYYSSGQFRITTIDATALDPDTYYPVTFTLYSATDYKATFDIGTVLGASGKPPWATHAQGFSCNCAWESNGNRWGTLPVKRYIHSFAYSFAESTPVGSIGQVIEVSMEYIYVRGGGRYTVRTSDVPFIELHPSGYHWTSGSSSGDLPTRTSIETPVVDVETAKTTAQSALGAANALSTTVTGLKNFTDSAFADGVVTRSEAAAIGKLTNQVAETAESVKAQYYNRYNHADLNETGKRNLAAKYALFDAAKAALLTSITTAIADGIATAAEQADVDTKHNAFNSALSELNVAFGVADETIRDAIRAYANSAVDTGQNAVAKNIGFSSYEDMTAKAEAGQHIIKGGRINADLIETATLIAENVITKPASDSDQRRIEIRRETNALTAYDSAGNTVLLVRGDTVDDVDTLINPAAVSLSSDFTPRSFSWSATSELEKYESAVCAELAVTSAGFYEISIPDIQAEHRTQCAAGAYSYGRMDFVLTTSDASDVLVQIPVAKGNTENWNTHVRAGTYTVYAKSRLYLRVRFYGRLEGYASAQAAESMNVHLYTASQKVTCTGSTGSAMRTSLFANGMAATYSNQEYFVVFKGGAGIPYIMGRGDARLLSKSGKYGLRLTDSGVLATSNSTNDNNWGALMHGLVAWGVVNTGTGTIAKYWTSPAGNITSLTAAAGGTGYVTITMFGSGFASTSSYAVDAKPNNTNDRIVYASVQNKKTTSFKIGTGDGAGSVATDVVFFIFNLDTYKY
jgi:hypothetical protein bacD2_02385|nr:MAG TPA: tail protein [Caudoviricetes sp.]